MSNEPVFSAWNPGIEADIPQQYRHLETIYQSGTTNNRFEDISELSRQTGLSPEELVEFPPSRLALHEVMIRVTADIFVREGDTEENLGINFRKIANTMMSDYVEPIMGELEVTHVEMVQKITDFTRQSLKAQFSPDQKKPQAPTFLQKIFGKAKPEKQVVSVIAREERELNAITTFKNRGLEKKDPLEAAVYRSLYRVLSAVSATRGYLGHDIEFLVKIATRHAANFHGSRLIGKRVESQLRRAIEEGDYQYIPDAKKPILISLKGASAAGKSSLRPRLQEMIKSEGIEQDGYGTISPDIWRRMLLDYDSLGNAFKYAGRLTSLEVNIIDAKLDRYIRGKAQHRHSIPHLMVDRFRFDSFASEKVSNVLHNTYVSYIDTMYMFFVITPPEATVERGWIRGEDRGRYKSVEDFLGHCVEAYSGIPRLLFRYLDNPAPHFKFEFLDNSVALGEYPLMIARGTQGCMEIHDPIAFINIERYQKINILAKSPDQVYPDSERLAIDKNISVLKKCLKKIRSVTFIDPGSEKIYVESQRGKLSVVDPSLLESKLRDEQVRQIFQNLGLTEAKKEPKNDTTH
ncbi:MAG: hypothetical protein ACI845_002710 [Gammaproteobacteria bacterium]|jgi:hypothetical protein